MKRLVLGVAAALALSAGQAAADGLPSRGHVAAPPEAAAPTWNGFYLGVGVGAGAAVFDENGFAPAAGGDGTFGTVTVGYDRVIGPRWVAGAFVDYDFSNITARDADIDLQHAWSIGGRLGFLANPSMLMYGTAGYTQAEFALFGETHTTLDGYFVGAGIEGFLRQNWTLKLEYRFSQFGEETVIEDITPSTHTARLVLSYKFGQRD